MKRLVFLFGEAERGALCTPHLCRSLPQLEETFGNPPEKSQGLGLAVQTLLFDREVIYFRVREEGFNHEEYKKGMDLLEGNAVPLSLLAIAIPGVGDHEIIQLATNLCHLYKTCLILGEKDLYDYLTSK